MPVEMCHSIIFRLLLVASAWAMGLEPGDVPLYAKSKFLCKPKLEYLEFGSKQPQLESKVVHPDSLFYYQFEDFDVKELTGNRFQVTASMLAPASLFEMGEKRALPSQMQIVLIQQDAEGKELARQQVTKPLGKEFSISLETKGKKVKALSLACSPITSDQAEELDIVHALEAESRYRKRAEKPGAPSFLGKKYENVVEWAFQHIQALPDSAKRAKYTKELSSRVASLRNQKAMVPLMSSVGQAAYADGDVNLILAYVKLRSLEDSIPRYGDLMQDGVGNVRDIIEHDKTDLLEVAVMLEALKTKPAHADMLAWHKKLDQAYLAQTKKIDLSKFPKEEIVTVE